MDEEEERGIDVLLLWLAFVNNRNMLVGATRAKGKLNIIGD